MKNYYKTLELLESATTDEIKTAFRRIAKQTHPDMNPHNQEAHRKFQQANEAYEVLSDIEKRKQYDEKRKETQEKQSTNRRSSYQKQPTAHSMGFESFFSEMMDDFFPSEKQSGTDTTSFVDTDGLFQKFMGFRPK